MNSPNLQIEHDGAVATLWLNRPEVHNAFDEHLIAALTHALRALEADAAVRVIVLAGRGRSFCAGGDLDWMRRMAGFSHDENLRDAGALATMLATLASCAKPTIARVHGAALAGGTGLVATCDIALATPNASFGTTEVRLGLIPATISPYVIRAIGARAAQRYFLTGERFDAAQAQQLGLIHEVCEPEALDTRVGEVSEALLAGAPRAQSACKHLVQHVAAQPISTALIHDTTARIAAARNSDEAHEGVAAFFAKRLPDWSA
ncbi:enoyl-CoA hydratase/isomerase family protein [Pseudoxanthomonas sp.]|uniref:enoyl-CoA hydratase/isomerase family protein n=1 Tax=Pseudoxanthomonas sp. TaxID=1871049 RepID=UPI002609A136|nr:enoyl-CoA hydratase/isomerase family protein [Pseudoxanthomonas sp.]WDS35909.1 MAG: enoyl-CoA hydratase/isomerase family protein [Pseudoxanthomonas sp.]